MANHGQIVIAGGGRVGFRVAQFFEQRGHDVKIIEKAPDRLQEHESDGIEVIAGDATRPSVLSAALGDETSVIGALTDSDSTNLAVCLAARTFDSDIRTVARITEADSDEYAELVDEVVFLDVCLVGNDELIERIRPKRRHSCIRYVRRIKAHCHV